MPDTAADALASAVQEHLARFVEVGAMDIVAVDDDHAVEVQTDTWTLYLGGWPLATAWIALDEDAVSPKEQERVLTTTLNAKEFAALRALDASLSGALVTALRASHDPISTTLAGLIER